MATPGWYADPAGQPGRFRFWDGQSWSEQTTADPYNTPPPGQGPGQAPPQQQPHPQPQQQAPPQQRPQPPQQPSQNQPQQFGQSQQPQPQQPQSQPQPGQPWQQGQASGWPQAAGAGAPNQPPNQPQNQPQNQPGATQPGQGWGAGSAGGGAMGGGPMGGGTGDGSGKKSGRKTLMAIIGVVVVIALIIGGIFAIRAFAGGDDEKDKKSDAESSQSGDPSGDSSDPSGDSSESGDPSEDPSESGSTDPDDKGNRPVAGKECTAGNPLKRTSKDTKGRIVGGGLSFAVPKGYKPQPVAGSFTFSHDVGTTTKVIEKGWVSVLMVGRLRAADGFTSPKQAADAVLSCMAASDQFYASFKSRKDLISEKGSVNKLPAWRIRSEIRIDDPKLKAKGDLADVIVVKLGKKQLGVYIGVAPLGDGAGKQVLKRTLDTLKAQ